MLQFYFLSVFLNLLAGLLLFLEDDDRPLDLEAFFPLKEETLRFVLGIASALVGLLKILSAIEGDIPVLGDIVPAIANFLCGFILLYEYYRRRSSAASEDAKERLEGFLLSNRKIIGAAAFIAALLHFLFPRVLLL